MTEKLVAMLKTLLISYIITAILLLLLALGLYKFNMSAWQITAGVIVTYALSTFVGGYILARKQKTRRLLWGVALGVIYFVILTVISLLMNKGVGIDTTYAIRAVLICVGAGAIGAFATPVQTA